MILASASRTLSLLLGLGLSAQAPQLAPDVAARPPAGCKLQLPPAQARLFGGGAWDRGFVPYRYAANVTPAMMTAMGAAMQEIGLAVRVNFVQQTVESDYVLIRDSVINSSPIGRVGGPQMLDIANWNSRFEMVHALMHVLGFWHEHQRPDRDQFVAVDFNSVDPLRALEFQRIPVGVTYGLPYDFDSVLHFGGTEGGIGGATTITVLPPNQAQQGAIGQRTHLSLGDIEAMRRTYGSLQPPTLTSLSPSVVPTFQPPQVFVTGVLFDEVQRLRFDTVAIPFTVISPTQLRFALPSQPTIGTHTITLESGAGFSAPLPLTVTGNDPPVLTGPSLMSHLFTLPYHIHSDTTRINVLLASFDNNPSSAPGIISLGIGSQFTTIIVVASGVAAPNGDLQVNLRANGVPTGLQIWMQSYVFDPANLVLPLASSNVLQATIV